MTDTHARQQAGAPNSIGGQFKATTKSETTGRLTSNDTADEIARRAERDMLTAFQNADGPIRRAREAALRAADTAILAKFPTAARARFERQFDSENFYLNEITDEHGTSLWTEDEDGQWDEVDSFIGMLDDDADQYLRRGDTQDRAVEVLNLHLGETEPRNGALGIHIDSLSAATDRIANVADYGTDPEHTRAFKAIADARGALDRLEYVTAATAINDVVGKHYPTATELVLDDRNYEGEGSPYWGPAFILDADHRVLWSNDDDELGLENDLYEYTPLLDRLGDPTLPGEPGSSTPRFGIYLKQAA